MDAESRKAALLAALGYFCLGSTAVYSPVQGGMEPSALGFESRQQAEGDKAQAAAAQFAQTTGGGAGVEKGLWLRVSNSSTSLESFHIFHTSHFFFFYYSSKIAKGQDTELSVSSQSLIDFILPSGSKLSAMVFAFSSHQSCCKQRTDSVILFLCGDIMSLDQIKAVLGRCFYVLH